MTNETIRSAYFFFLKVASVVAAGAGSFGAELFEAITAYLDHDNASPTPFVWTATASGIPAKVKRARRKLHTPR